MRILTAGGGSGGHVTPVVAVVDELLKRHPEAEIRFWCDSAFEKPARDMMHQVRPEVRVEVISSGKFRRYNAIAWWRQLLRVRTILWPNLRDLFKIAYGTVQSLVKILYWRPDIVFTKGGYVCLPIGLAARLLGVPLVIHDSDAHPGLTNRILSRWAVTIATGAPTKYYRYPKDKMVYVGIPIKTRQPASSSEQRLLKSKLGFDADRCLLVVTGGGLGAKRINDAVVKNINSLLDITDVALISGQAQYDELRQRLGENTKNFQLHAFIAKNFSSYFAAADVVVSRAGMTSLLELAALGKPAIIVPNIHLTGAHQQKNAQVFLDSDAILTIDDEALEKDPNVLIREVSHILADRERRDQLSQNISSFAKPAASQDMADIILESLKKPVRQ